MLAAGFMPKTRFAVTVPSGPGCLEWSGWAVAFPRVVVGAVAQSEARLGARAVVLTGAGRYADPWHRFAETTARLVEILAEAGIAADVADDVDEGLAALESPDLLVVNAGDPWRGSDPTRGVPAAGLADLSLIDERYTGLAVDRHVVVLASHRHEGTTFPLLWAREYGRSRVVYDALGHDSRSYDSPAHRELIQRAALWVSGDRVKTGPIRARPTAGPCPPRRPTRPGFGRPG
jgi:hypothetical protein